MNSFGAVLIAAGAIIQTLRWAVIADVTEDEARTGRKKVPAYRSVVRGHAIDVVGWGCVAIGAMAVAWASFGK